MARTLTAGMQTEIAANTGEFVHFMELVFSGGTQRLSTGSSTMTWNGQTWTAIGGALSVAAITETPDLSAGSLEITLSGVDRTILAVLLSQYYIGRSVKVWLVHLNTAAGTVVADPVLLFSGFMNGGWTVSETRGEGKTPGTVTVRGRCVSRLAALDVRKGLQTNMGSHQTIYKGDKFFEHVDTLTAKRVVWSR